MDEHGRGRPSRRGPACSAGACHRPPERPAPRADLRRRLHDGGQRHARGDRGAPGCLWGAALGQAEAGRGTRPRACPSLARRDRAQRDPRAAGRRCARCAGRAGGAGRCRPRRAERPGSRRAAPHVAGAPSGRALAGLGCAPGEARAATRRAGRHRAERARCPPARHAPLARRRGS